MADIHKYTSKEVLNKVLLDSSGDAVNAFSHTTSEALNAALDDTNSRLNVSLEGGTIGGDVTISGDLTVTGSSTYSYTEAISGTGTAKANFDILTLTNAVSAADMDGTETSVLFNQYYYDASTPAVADAGRISIGTETDWTGVALTQDSYMAFETALNGTVTEYMRITSAGNVGIGTTAPTAILTTYIADAAPATSGSTATGVGLRIAQDGGTNCLDIGHAGTYGWIQATRSADLSVETDLSINPNGGNVGIGVVPDDSWASYTALQIGEIGSISAHPDGTGAGSAVKIGSNVYYNSGYKYIIADEASLYTQDGGFHIFETTSTVGSHAGAVTFTTNMKLDSSSRISLSNNDTGVSNTIFGKNAGDPDGAGDQNVYVGELAGGAGIQTDASDNNVGIGYSALTAITQGVHNVAVGDNAASRLTTGGKNTIIGRTAGEQITDEEYCTLVGYSAGAALTTTAANGTTALGYQALTALTSGATNTAIGYHALTGHTTGGANVALGYGALKGTDGATASTSSHNIAIGYNALGGDWNDGTASNYNIAIGGESQDGVLNGALGNVSMGYDSLGGLTEGDNNTVIGHNGGNSITTGSQNTGVGGATAFDIDANNQTCVGYQATTDGANQVHIGNTSVGEIEGQVSFATFSDKRIKTDIKDGDLGLDFIKLLKPKKFKKVNPAKYPDSIRNPQDGVDEKGNEHEWTDAQANKVWDGLIAQDVKEAIDACGTSYSGWREKKNSKQVLEYEALVVPLIKAVQELTAKVEALEKK